MKNFKFILINYLKYKYNLKYKIINYFNYNEFLDCKVEMKN